MRSTRLAVGSTLAIAFALAAVSTARGLASDVQITTLLCNSDPELVAISNLGDAAQGLAGWELQSDPPDSQVFDLSGKSVFPGVPIFITSGPSASGIFIWTTDEVFRDDDPTDYARLVDDTGSVVHQVNCGVDPGSTPESTPEPTPTAAPTPSPEPSPLADLPNGDAAGGAATGVGALAPAAASIPAWAAIASGLGGAGLLGSLGALAALALPRVRLRSSLPVGRPRPRRRGRDSPRRTAFFGLALMALAVAVVFLLLQREH